MTKEDIEVIKQFKKARSNMVIGWAYSIDKLIDVDKLSDKVVLAVMNRLNNHPLITIDTNLPRRWSLK